MKLPFWDGPDTYAALARDGVLEELCSWHHAVLIATPYLSFESRLLAREGEVLLLRATMSREVVRHTLSEQALRLRFAWGMTFYGGATRVLGYEQGEGGRVLKLAVPERLAVDESRRAFRLALVGRSSGAIGSEDGPILRVTLEDLSPFGAAVFCLEPLPAEGFHAGRRLRLSLTLEGGFSFTAEVRIRHGSGQTLGLAFEPPLEGDALAQVQAWMAPRLKEVARRWMNRAEIRAQAEQYAQTRPAPEGLLVLGGRPELVEGLRASLEGLAPLRVCPPALGPLRAVLQVAPPQLVLVDLPGDTEARMRLRALLEAAGLEAPLMLLAEPARQEVAQAFAQELRNAACFAWTPEDAPFFRRVVQWRLRRLALLRPEGGAS